MQKFKKGDLIQMNNQFCSTKHPPMGTYGIIIHAEDWGDPVFDGNSDSNELHEAEQFIRVHWAHDKKFIRVHWAHDKNTGDQCYMNTSLKKAKA